MKWIDCKDRLPAHEPVMPVGMNENITCETCLVVAIGYAIKPYVTTALWTYSSRERKYMWQGCTRDFSDNITHWMPLPELPHVSQLPKGYKLCRQEVLAIRILLKEGMKHAEIAKRFGVHRSTITRINTGARWA